MSDIVGKMRKVVKFYKNTPAQQGAGWKDNYALLLTTRGYLKKDFGDRNGAFGEISSDSSFTLFVRKQDALQNNLSVSIKLIIDNYWYTINSWEEVEHLVLFYRFKIHRKEKEVA